MYVNCFAFQNYENSNISVHIIEHFEFSERWVDIVNFLI